MSCPSWQWHWQRTWTGYRWSPVRTLPVAPLWCDLGRCSRTVVVIKLRQTSAFWLSSRQSVKKSPFRVTLQEKWHFGCLWLRSRIRAHNKLSEAEQLLGLFQLNLLFALYQSSSSHSHCQLKSTKVSLDLCLTRPDFLSQEATYSLQLALMKWERKAQVSS